MKKKKSWKLLFFFKFLFSSTTNSSNATSDLLGLSTPPSAQSNQSTLIDVLGDMYNPNSAISNAKK